MSSTSCINTRDADLHTSVTLITAFLMSVGRMTSSEAVRTVVGGDVEDAADLCDRVEADLAAWEVDVNGLVTERLKLGGLTSLSSDKYLEIDQYSARRLENYYSVFRYFLSTNNVHLFF